MSLSKRVRRKTRKWCFVPGCSNTTFKTPEKRFVSVPSDTTRRQKWFVAARRNIAEVSPKSTLYCCDDHFNLKDDMDNYWEYTLSKTRARMKPEAVPHMFACQSDRQLPTTKRKILKCLEIETDKPSTSTTIEEHSEIPVNATCEVTCQTKLKLFISEGVQVLPLEPKKEMSAFPTKFEISKLPSNFVNKLDFDLDVKPADVKSLAEVSDSDIDQRSSSGASSPDTDSIVIKEEEVYWD